MPISFCRLTVKTELPTAICWLKKSATRNQKLPFLKIFLGYFSDDMKIFAKLFFRSSLIPLPSIHLYRTWLHSWSGLTLFAHKIKQEFFLLFPSFLFLLYVWRRSWFCSVSILSSIVQLLFATQKIISAVIEEVSEMRMQHEIMDRQVSVSQFISHSWIQSSSSSAWKSFYFVTHFYASCEYGISYKTEIQRDFLWFRPISKNISSSFTFQS